MSDPLAELSDLERMGLPSAWLATIQTVTQELALSAASDLALSYLARRYTLPIVSWGNDVRRAVCHIASWDLACRKGFDPESAHDVAIRLRYTDAIKWLEGVASGAVIPSPIEDSSTSTLDPSGPFLTSDCARGW